MPPSTCDRVARLAQLARDANVDFCEPLGTLSLVKAQRPLIVRSCHQEEAARLVRSEARGPKTINLFHRHTASIHFRYKAEHIERALFRLIQDNGSAIVAQCLLEHLRRAHDLQGKRHLPRSAKVPRGLLTHVVRQCPTRLDLIHVLAPWADAAELTSTLDAIIDAGHKEILSLLIHFGADPNQLQHHIKAAIRSGDSLMLNIFLSGLKPLTTTTFETLLHATIESKSLRFLTFLLQSPGVARPTSKENGPAWNRDEALGAAVQAQQINMLIAIAHHTATLPLSSSSLYETVFRCGVGNASTIITMTQVLLWLDTDAYCDHFWGQSSAWLQCHHLSLGLLSLLVSHNVLLSAVALRYACEEEDVDLFLRALRRNTASGDEVWQYMSRLPAVLQTEAKERVLVRLLASNTPPGQWTQQALLFAVEASKTHRVTHLLMKGADVNYNQGEAVKAALNSRNEAVFKLLMTRQLSVAVLESTLAAIWRLSKDQKLEFMTLILKQNIPLAMISPFLDQALCDYTENRDFGLIRVLANSKASCSSDSIASLVNHSDTGILQYLFAVNTRELRTKPFIHGSTRSLAKLLVILDEPRLRDSVFQLVDLHISIVAKQESFVLTDHFDLLAACRAGPIDTHLMRMFEKHYRHLPLASRLEASALIIQAQDLSLTRMFIDSWAVNLANGNGQHSLSDLATVVKHLSSLCFEDDADKALKLEYMLRPYRDHLEEQDLRADCLERHVRSLANSNEEADEWPVRCIEELLQGQSKIDDRFYSCFRITSMHQQTHVLARLLPPHKDELAVGGDILRPLLRYNKGKSLDYFIRRGLQLGVARQIFDYARMHRFDGMGILLLRHATRHEHTESCSCLKSTIWSSQGDYVDNLVRRSRFTAVEIDQFWSHLALQPFESDKYGRAKVLIRNELSLRFVRQILMRAAHAQDNDLCRLVLELRGADSKTVHGDSNLDGGSQQKTNTGCGSNLVRLGSSPLHGALRIAIAKVNVELCDLLLDHKAPMAIGKSFLLRQAVEADSIPLLRTVLAHTSEAMRARVLDESLWLATIFNNAKLCAFLLGRGACPLHDDYRALKCAADRGLVSLLELFDLKRLPAEALESAFTKSQSTILRINVPHAQRMSVIQMFLDAGVSKSDVLSLALVSLALEKKPSVDIANLLLANGATLTYGGGSCLINARNCGHAGFFKHLCTKLDDPNVASTCLIQVCAEYRVPGASKTTILDIISTLLKFEISKDVLSAELAKALKLTIEGRADIDLVHLLLDHHAYIQPDSSELLYHACMSDDPRVIMEAFCHGPAPLVLRKAMTLLCSGDLKTSADQIRCMSYILAGSEVVDKVESPMLVNWLQKALVHKKWSEFIKSLLSRKTSTGAKLSTLLTSDDGATIRDLLIWAIRKPPFAIATDNIADLITHVLADCPTFRLRGLVWPTNHEAVVLMAMKHDRPKLVSPLLTHGASADVMDADGKSALCLALEQRYSSAAESLFMHSTLVNDGSLHAAMCSQYWKLMRWMVERKHCPLYRAPAYKHMTALEAFLRHDHEEQHLRTLGFTVKLLSEISKSVEIWVATPSHLSAALHSKHPLELTKALVDNMPRWIANISEPHFRDNHYYSTLSLVEKGLCPHLISRNERALIEYLEVKGFQRAYYVAEGVQPADAVNVPEAIVKREDDRQRLLAFETRLCSVCDEKPDDAFSFHAWITDTCKQHHSWQNDIICSDCLRQHIFAQIFPDGLNNHAITSPRCHTCQSTISHSQLQSLIDAPTFEQYDAALLQQTLHSTLSSARCANTAISCKGGAWFSASDLDELTFFRCPVCVELTCLLCNQMYEKHRNMPCPVGQQKKREDEDEKSEETVKSISKECECGARIQKAEGCDHMTCNRCRSEWCYECLVPYDRIRSGDNSAHDQKCKHWRPARRGRT